VCAGDPARRWAQALAERSGSGADELGDELLAAPLARHEHRLEGVVVPPHVAGEHRGEALAEHMRMEGHFGSGKQWHEVCETAALDVIRNQATTRQGYVHELSAEGIIEQVKWANRGGGKWYPIMTLESVWFTSTPQVAE
ncbi:MAG: hypothetical protein ACKPKO_56975, partial [Candidatus Fonsibacter sp.]